MAISKRFSLRQGIENEPPEPLFEEVPDRLRYFVVEFVKSSFYDHVGIGTVGRALCRPHLLTGSILRQRIWSEVLSDEVFACEWWQLYNLAEEIYKDLPKMGSGRERAYVNALNGIFAEESVGWRMDENGRIQRLLPAAAEARQEEVFRELQAPRFQSAWANMLSAYNAYNARPRQDQDVCSAVVDALESVAKVVMSMPTATLGDVIKQARARQVFDPATLRVVENIYGLACSHFRHGMTEQFKLKPSEVEFVYMSSIGGMLMFIRAFPA